MFSYCLLIAQMIQVAVQQPKTLLTAADDTHFLLIQSNYTSQVWDSSKIDSNVRQVNYNPTGSIVAMASAAGGNRVISYGQSRPWLGTITDINKGG